jgi:hypothetical protein
MARGLTYAEAARETGRAPSTVRSHLHTAYGRLGVTTISQALATCTYIGWLDAVARDGVAVELADRRVTWAQRLYLEAFDQSLRAGENPDEVERTHLLRRAALEGMYHRAGKQPPPWRRTATDPLDRIVQTLQRLETRGGAETEPAHPQQPVKTLQREPRTRTFRPHH